MILTKSVISFSFTSEDTELDYIPLAEVRFVMEMRDTADFNTLLSDPGQHDASNGLHVLQIATEPNGHNSGRAYYVRASSKESCEKLLNQLNRGAKEARKAAEAKNAFRKTQYNVRKVYESQLFQAFTAAMISAVS